MCVLLYSYILFYVTTRVNRILISYAMYSPTSAPATLLTLPSTYYTLMQSASQYRKIVLLLSELSIPYFAHVFLVRIWTFFKEKQIYFLHYKSFEG